MRENSSSSTSSPVLGVVSLFNFCHSGRSVMVSQCGFYLHLPNDWCRTSILLCAYLLSVYLLFGELSKSFVHLKNLSYNFNYRCSLTYYGVTSQSTHLKLKTSNVQNAFKTPNLLRIVAQPGPPWTCSGHVHLSACGRAEPPTPRTRSRASGFGLVTAWPAGRCAWLPPPSISGERGQLGNKVKISKYSFHWMCVSFTPL